MPIEIVSGSISLHITQRPRVNPPALLRLRNMPDPIMGFTSTPLVADGRCILTGNPGADPGGWTLGIIQLQWIETNWAHYRGRENTDGSLLLQRGRPPARPAQACRDTMVAGAIFVDNSRGGFDKTIAAAGAALPFPMSARLSDDPLDYYDLTRVNSLTRRVNFLREVQIEFHFCTVLSLMSPSRRFQHLKHFSWNLHWQAAFEPTNFSDAHASWSITPHRSGRANAAHVGSVSDGAPGGHNFQSVLTAPGAPNCNAVLLRAERLAEARESSTWTHFDVRR